MIDFGGGGLYDLTKFSNDLANQSFCSGGMKRLCKTFHFDYITINLPAIYQQKISLPANLCFIKVYMQ